ncbi:MAG: ATP-dependent DNA helicase RecG [Calditrichaeota bacterium]|nr:ATP-dependent DNA helicase RecG [Calditrichota bacterium]
MQKRSNTQQRPLSEIPVAAVPGVGTTKAKALRKIGVETVEDLLYYFPRRYLDRSDIRAIKDLEVGTDATVVGRVVSAQIQRGRRSRFVLTLSDGTGFLQCVWFHGLQFLPKAFNKGDQVAVSGRVGMFGHFFQMTHPEFDRLSAANGTPVHTSKIIPLYPSSQALDRAQLDSRGFRRTLHACLTTFGARIVETLPDEIRKRQKLTTLRYALQNVHFPESAEALRHARRRLKFDELFYLELLLALRRKVLERGQKGLVLRQVGEKTRELVSRLPFELTPAQRRVLREIYADMRSDRPMHRLLQGDVGSGKTVVALVAMLMAVENGYQAAIMAPTEILAEQHFLNIRSFLQELDVRVRLLIGGQSAAERREILEEVASGEADIVVGTHALIQEGVTFAKLGLVVIDEQHRFGVVQRRLLQEKGPNPDVLVMTATPIPRTLSLTLYGDLDVSVIDELPAGRKKVRTVWRPAEKRGAIYNFVRDEVRKGRQAYIVFPLVEESEKSDLKAATESYERMKESVFRGLRVGLLHGRMPNAEKEAVMRAFKSGEVQILVSTTVIEVGVDVPNATVMVIEHAERFGLTQLHQLRGRVGRGGEQSYCILVAYEPISDEAKQRLETMVKTSDGFKIAEVDLRLRGPGEFFGTRQHGFPALRIADVVHDYGLLVKAREEAFRLIEQDPHLTAPEHQRIRDHFLRHYRERLDFVKVA